MGEEKWRRRKPGRASGTVVPPPVGDDAPPLPEPRRPGRTRQGPDGLSHADAQPPGPEIPDNVRLLFRPVLRPGEGRPGKDRKREPNFRPIRSTNANEVLELPSHPVHGSAGQAWHARRGEGASPAGSTVRTQLPPSGGWQPENGVGAGLGTPVSPDTAGMPGYRRHLAWMAALTVLLLLTAAGTTVALLGQPGGGKPAVGGPWVGGSGGGGGSGTALAQAAASRVAAARWVSREISRSEIIGCDTVMCGVLIKSGVPSADLLPITRSSPDPLGADVLVATPVLQSQFASRLSTEYAPAVLASFGTGNARVEVRVVASYGARAYQLALNRDLAARDLLGTELVGNSQIALPVSAKTELAAGQVDPRLLITLPPLAQRHPIRVIAFYDRAPGASSGVPLSGVRLAGWDPKAGLSAHAYLRWLVSYLRSQRSVYRAADVATTWRNGRAIVSVRFARPNPIGLLH